LKREALRNEKGEREVPRKRRKEKKKIKGKNLKKKNHSARGRVGVKKRLRAGPTKQRRSPREGAQ